MDTIKATWNGPFVGDLGPGRPPLQLGDEIEITPSLAESAHFTVKAPGAPAQSPAPVATTPAASAAKATSSTEASS